MFIKVLFLVLFFAVTISVGIYFRKRALNVNDFVLGGRSVGPWISAFSYGSTYFSAVVFVGFAGQFGWRFGSAAVWIGLGNAFIGSLLAWMVLGRRTRVITNHLKSATMPDFFGARYMSPALKICSAIIVFVFLIPYTASLYNGLSRLFAVAFNIPFEYCIIAIGILTAIFVVIGGYIATAFNDFIQGSITLCGIIAVVLIALGSKGGFMAANDALARVDAPEFAPGIFASFFGPDPVSLLGVVILTSLGAWGLPQMIARFYSIKSEKQITKGAVISTIFAVFVAGGCYFLGSYGRLFAEPADVAANGFDSIIPAIVSGFGSDALIGLVIVLVFAASISTLSSLVMTSSSTLTLDFLKGHIIKKMSEKQQLLIIRGLILVFIAISSVIAIIQYRGGITFIAQLMGISWGALAGAFLAPFLYGLYWKRASKASVWCCFIFSTFLMTANILFRDHFPEILKSPINAGAFTMLAGLVIIPIVSIFTHAPDQKSVENCFACVQKDVV